MDTGIGETDRPAARRAWRLLLLVALAIAVPGAVSVSAALTTYTVRADFDSAAGATTDVDFSTNFQGDPITSPPQDVNISPLPIGGVLFEGSPALNSYYDLFIYTFPQQAIRATPACSTGFLAVGFSYKTFYNVSGTYTVRLSTGDTFPIFDPSPPTEPRFFGFVSDTPVQWVSVEHDSTYVWMDDFSFRLGATAVTCPLCNACRLDQGCVPAPRTGCTSGGISGLQLKNASPDDRDKLTWTWKRGAVAAADLGDPTTTTDYALCIYDGASSLALETSVPAGGTCLGKPCWKGLGKPPLSKGASFKDKSGANAGVVGLTAKVGVSTGSLKMTGKGANLPFPTSLSLTTPVRTQLQAAGGGCWETTYTSAIRNDATQFKAKGN